MRTLIVLLLCLVAITGMVSSASFDDQQMIRARPKRDEEAAEGREDEDATEAAAGVKTTKKPAAAAATKAPAAAAAGDKPAEAPAGAAADKPAGDKPVETKPEEEEETTTVAGVPSMFVNGALVGAGIVTAVLISNQV